MSVTLEGRVGGGVAMFDHIFRGIDIAIIVLREEEKGKARFDIFVGQ